jgi:short-subunit dehydrogenase
MKNILIVGGANGIGLSIATELAGKESCDKVYIVDKLLLSENYNHPKITSLQFDLKNNDYSFFEQFTDIDTLFISAGFGKLSLFKDLDEDYIEDSFRVNSIAPIKIIHHFIDKLQSFNDFYCGVMVSIAGFMSSPFFSVYGATKAALKIFIESVNVELEKKGTKNRILNVSPGSIQGTSFTQGKTDLLLTKSLANDIILNLEHKNDLFIPKYEEVFKEVLERYHKDFREEGRHSYDYKLNTGRIK